MAKSPVNEVYPIVFIDAIHYHVRENNVTMKKTVYDVLGIIHNGVKEVIMIGTGGNESSKFWLSVFNNLKSRGIKDIFVVYTDGLSEIKETIKITHSLAEYQCCIVHQICNTLGYVSYKDYKVFCNNFNRICYA